MGNCTSLPKRKRARVEPERDGHQTINPDDIEGVQRAPTFAQNRGGKFLAAGGFASGFKRKSNGILSIPSYDNSRVMERSPTGGMGDGNGGAADMSRLSQVSGAESADFRPRKAALALQNKLNDVSETPGSMQTGFQGQKNTKSNEGRSLTPLTLENLQKAEEMQEARGRKTRGPTFGGFSQVNRDLHVENVNQTLPENMPKISHFHSENPFVTPLARGALVTKEETEESQQGQEFTKVQALDRNASDPTLPKRTDSESLISTGTRVKNRFRRAQKNLLEDLETQNENQQQQLIIEEVSPIHKDAKTTLFNRATFSDFEESPIEGNQHARTAFVRADRELDADFSRTNSRVMGMYKQKQRDQGVKSPEPIHKRSKGRKLSGPKLIRNPSKSEKKPSGDNNHSGDSQGSQFSHDISNRSADDFEDHPGVVERYNDSPKKKRARVAPAAGHHDNDAPILDERRSSETQHSPHHGGIPKSRSPSEGVAPRGNPTLKKLATLTIPSPHSYPRKPSGNSGAGSHHQPSRRTNSVSNLRATDHMQTEVGEEGAPMHRQSSNKYGIDGIHSIPTEVTEKSPIRKSTTHGDESLTLPMRTNSMQRGSRVNFTPNLSELKDRDEEESRYHRYQTTEYGSRYDISMKSSFDIGTVLSRSYVSEGGSWITNRPTEKSEESLFPGNLSYTIVGGEESYMRSRTLKYPSQTKISRQRSNQLDLSGTGRNTSYYKSQTMGNISMNQTLADPDTSVITTSNISYTRSETGKKKINDYILLETIGRGGYGKVKKAVHAVSKKQFAIKILSKKFLRKKHGMKKGQDPLASVRTEIAIMKKLLHVNIVRLFEILEDEKEDYIYMVMEYVKHGPAIKTHTAGVEPLPTKKCWGYFRDLISGLEYLHNSVDIIHRDIKPENLLIDSSGRLKIADFGVSHLYENAQSRRSIKDMKGTHCFMAPEMFQGTYKNPIDIWAAGVTLFYFTVGRLPFFTKAMAELRSMIINRDPDYPEKMNASLKDLLQGMLRKDPTKRMTLQEIREHDWVTSNGMFPLNELDVSMIGNPSADEVEGALDPILSQHIIRIKQKPVRRKSWNPEEKAPKQWKLLVSNHHVVVKD